MDCSRSSRAKAVLPPTFPRLVGNAWLVNPTSRGFSQLLRLHDKRELGWNSNMSPDRLLSAPRTHPGVWGIPQFLHSKPWYIEHSRHHPLVGVPNLGSGSSFCSLN
nr:cold-related protein Cor413 [Ipomoea batatas]